MDELIKITTNDAGQQLISGRELFEFLEAKERYSKWFDRMIGYGFVEGIDYTPYQKVHPLNDQEITDHVLTIDMAKEISMLQRTEKGKQARLYFIEVEKHHKKQQLDTSNLSPELQFMNSVVQSLAKQEMETKRLETKVDNISDIIALNTTDWRKESRQLINKMAKSQGGHGAYQEIQADIYQELDRRANSNLSIRLENKRNRMAGAGISQTKINKTNKLDVIGENKRLLEIYLAVVKEFAIKYGVWKDE